MIQYVIEKILGYTSISLKDKIDRLLEMDATIYCNLGIDSTKTERQEAKTHSRIIYRAIKQLDERLGNSLLQAMDR